MTYSPSSSEMMLTLEGQYIPPPNGEPPPNGTPPPPTGQIPKTLTVFFWDSEEFFESPARRTRQLVFKNLISATLAIDISFTGLLFQNVTLNGRKISENTLHDTVDVTNDLKLGSNEARLNYQTLLGNIGFSAGVATVYVEMLMNITDAELDDIVKRTETANKEEGGGFDLKTAVILGGVAVATVGGIVLISSLRKSPVERSIEKITQLRLLKELKDT